MNKYRFVLYLSFFMISFMVLNAVEAIDFSIRVDSKLDTSNGLKAIVSWKPDSNAKEYVIKRKLVSDKEWTDILFELDSTATGFIDSTIISGLVYEYFIKKKSVVYTDTSDYIYDGYAYICMGDKYITPSYNGRLLLLIDSTVYDSLKTELEGYIYDLTGDGWWVKPILVPRTEIFNPEAVDYIKQIVKNEYILNDDSLSALILFGRVAVPYSGNNGVDGHENHQGAWVADVYYSDIFGNYTDEKILDTIAERKENMNIPNDGKFDNTRLADKSLLMVGRVDFYYLRYFKISETELYRNYLKKNHDFRFRKFIPSYQSIIDDNFGLHGEKFASLIRSDFTALLGSANVQDGDFVRPLDSEPIIMSFGCGSGSYWGVTNTLSLYNLDTANTGGVFSMLFGSYNGDWDVRDNILRSQIAYSQYGLTCSWPGRPFWNFHHLSMGFPIGYSTRITQNNQVLYESNNKYGNKYMHISLLGDPTLKMYYEPYPNNLQISSAISFDSKHVNLSWDYSEEEFIGFDIFRSDDILSKFKKLNDEPLQTKSFTDSMPNNGKNIYMIRAIKERKSTGGSFNNHSQAVFAETTIPYINFAGGLDYNLTLLPNPAVNTVNINYALPKEANVNLSVWDSEGKLVKMLENDFKYARYYSIYWNLLDSRNEKVQSGIYFIKMETNDKTLIEKLNIIH